jgi:hypothetical protein
MIVAVAVIAGAMSWLLRQTGPLPARWSSETFESAVRRAVDRGQEGKVEIRLLAWKTEEDDRPLLVDSALAWCRVESEDNVSWALVLLFRHPRDGPQWHLSEIYDHPWSPVRFYDHPPRNTDVYQFLDSEPHRPFFRVNRSGSAGFHILSSGVRVISWYSAIGERPTRFLPSQ